MLNEDTIQPYLNLIQALLQCPQGEEIAILQAHQELIDEGFLLTLMAMAEKLKEDHRENEANFLMGLAENLAQAMGMLEENNTGNQMSVSPENREDENIYLQLIQQLLTAEAEGNETQFYQIIAQYRHHFNDNLISTLQQWLNQLLPTLEDTQQNYLAGLLGDVCVTILQSPIGCWENEIKFTIASYGESATICRKLGLDKDLSSTLNNLGNAYLTFAEIGKDSEQNLKEAIASYGESATICRKLGLDKDLSSTLNNLGNAYLTFAQIGKDSEQNLKEAIASYGESATICRNLGLDKDLSNTLNNLGNAYRNFAEIGKDSEQNLTQAIASYGESATICRKLGLEKDLSRHPQ
jgi:tetratricopeptide (TPR) repeat protein